MYSVRHPFIHPFIHSFGQSLVRSLSHLCQSYSKPVIHSFIHSFIHLFIHSFIHLFIHSVTRSVSKPVIHSMIHSFIRHSVNCPVTHSFIDVTQVVKQSAEGRAGQWDSGHHSWGGGGPCRPARPQQRRASAGLWSVFFTASLLVHLVDFSQSSSLLLCLCIRWTPVSLLHCFSARASGGLQSSSLLLWPCICRTPVSLLHCFSACG